MKAVEESAANCNESLPEFIINAYAFRKERITTFEELLNAVAAFAEISIEPNFKIVKVNKSILKLRIEKNYLLGRNYYSRTVAKLGKAISQDKPFVVKQVEISTYGAKIEVELGGETYPLTKGKLRLQDIDFFFGKQPC